MVLQALKGGEPDRRTEKATGFRFINGRFGAGDAPRIGSAGIDGRDVPEATVRSCMGTMATEALLTLPAAETVVGMTGHEPVDHNLAAAAIRACFDGDDHADDDRAFMEKRAPSFRWH